MNATLVIAVMGTIIVPILVIIIRRIFDYLSEQSSVRREVFLKMFEDVHPRYRLYLKEIERLSLLSESVLDFVSYQTKEQALKAFYHFCLFVTQEEKDLIFLGNFEAEFATGVLNELVIPFRFEFDSESAPGRYVFDWFEITTIQKAVAPEMSLDEFRQLCTKGKLRTFFRTFNKWLNDSNDGYLKHYALWMRTYSYLTHYHTDMLYEPWYCGKPLWITSQMNPEEFGCVRKIVPEYGRSLTYRFFVRVAKTLGMKMKSYEIKQAEGFLCDEYERLKSLQAAADGH